MEEGKIIEEASSSSIPVTVTVTVEDEEEKEQGCFGNFVPPPLVPLHHHLQSDQKKIKMEEGKIIEEASSSSIPVTVTVDAPEEEENEEGCFGNFVPPPLVPLHHHLHNEQDDESLRRWKEKLLGCVEGDINGQVEPEVIFHSIGIISNDLGEINTPLPLAEDQSSKVLFSLREGSEYRLKLKFTVKHNIVSGLAYSNTVWRAGIQVDQSEGMLGTFAPQPLPYVHILEEETTPSGALARGVYLAKLRFVDDDKKCHMEQSYTFEIKRSS